MTAWVRHHELHFIDVWGEHFDHGTYVALAQASFKMVVGQSDCIEQFVHHLARERSDEPWDFTADRDEPDGDDSRLATVRSVQSTTDLVLLPVDAGLSRDGVAVSCECQQIVTKNLPRFCLVAGSRKHECLEATDWMNRREEIVPNLGWIDDCALGFWKHSSRVRGVSLRPP
jgi:hypothetical protein